MKEKVQEKVEEKVQEKVKENKVSRIIFMGTPEFAVPPLQMLVEEGYEVVAVITQPDKPKGRGKKLTPPPVKEYALKHGLLVLQPEKIKTQEFIDKMITIKPDLIITAAYGKILPQSLLDVPQYGCINVHASLLPKYRGAAPIHWAVINGDKTVGITTMQTDVGMDTGDILIMKGIDLPENMTTGELHDQMMQLGAETLKETLEKLKNGSLRRIKQDDAIATSAPMITKEIGLIDWNKTSKQIHDLIRGTNPWPGAYTFYKGDRLRIWKSELIESCKLYGEPGTICDIEKDGLIIATADGEIKVTEVQFDSCRKMGVCECGHNVDIGELLGLKETVN